MIKIKTKQNSEFCLPLKFKSSLSVIVRHLNVSVNSRSLIADVKLIIDTHLKISGPLHQLLSFKCCGCEL